MGGITPFSARSNATVFPYLFSNSGSWFQYSDGIAPYFAIYIAVVLILYNTKSLLYNHYYGTSRLFLDNNTATVSPLLF